MEKIFTFWKIYLPIWKKYFQEKCNHWSFLQNVEIVPISVWKVFRTARRNLLGNILFQNGTNFSNLIRISPKWKKISPFWRKFLHSSLQR
jgi:hypothetical protein